MNKKNIYDFLYDNKPTLKEYGVKKIGLFGSFLHDLNNEDSDIDLLVDFYEDKKNYDNFIVLAYFLEDNLKHKIDLLTTDSLSPYIGPKILKEVEYIDLST